MNHPRLWLTAVTITTALAGLVYLSGQQILRQGADDPQIQLAQDVAILGQLPDAMAGSQIDLSQTLSPAVAIYDKNGQLLKATGWLTGRVFAPPKGVFDYVRQHGEDRFTWQPQPNVRLATVIVKLANGEDGFVLATRSLREVEKRESHLLLIAGTVWLATVLFLTLVLSLPRRFSS